MKPAQSLKLQEIAQRDFVISGSKEHSITKTSNNFIPGVERKQLKKKSSTPANYDKLEDEEEDYEGGDTEKSNGASSHSESGSSHSKRKKKKKRMFQGINQSEHSRQYDNSLEIGSDECKSDLDIPKAKIQGISPGNLFKEEGTDTPIIEDIPMSVFDSSQSSDSDDTFDSYSKDELIDELNRERQHIIVEKLSEDESDSVNGTEQVIISLSDIPIEIDQGLDAKRNENIEYMSADNGKASRKRRKIKEFEVKLYPVESGGDFMNRSNTNPYKYEEFKNEVHVESTLKDLERQMIDSSKLKYCQHYLNFVYSDRRLRSIQTTSVFA